MPENAFYIGGHGSNHNDDEPTFIVPPGCVIVALAHMGEIALSFNGEHGIMSRMCSLSDIVLNNPIEHKAELIDEFKRWGSLAFYTEGQVCPNFYYELMSSYEKETGDIQFEKAGSGLIDLNNITELCDDHGQNINFQTNVIPSEKWLAKWKTTEQRIRSIITFFSNLFQNSVFPTRQDIYDILNTAKGYAAIGDEGTLTDRYKRTIKYISRKLPISITQKQLCSLFKGVFYNFVCRYTSNIDMFVKYDRYRETRNPNLEYPTATEAQRAHMRAHISEAVLHRRSAIRNWNNYTRKRQIMEERHAKMFRNTLSRRGGRRRKSRNHSKRRA